MGSELCIRDRDIEEMNSTLMPQIIEAVGIMEQARGWLEPSMESPTTQRIIDELHVSLVMYVHGFQNKLKHGRKQYHSLEEIAQDLVRDVQFAGGNISKAPWKLPPASPAASARLAASAPVAASAPPAASAPRTASIPLAEFVEATDAKSIKTMEKLKAILLSLIHI